MNRIDILFRDKKRNVLSVYCTAGFPDLEDTVPLMKCIEESGADMIELGMPYSDPLANGPVIQQSSTIALQNGMTIKKLFEQIKNFRRVVSIPVLLMGYMNPVLQFGIEKFCRRAAEAGVDGLILPDLPAFEFETQYQQILNAYNLRFVFLVTPETSEERVKKLDSLSSGFLYAVSSSSTTGASKNMTDVSAYLQRLKTFNLKNPVVVGFGIKDSASFSAACEHASGAIIGTAYIRQLQGNINIKEATATFLHSIIDGKINPS